MQNVSRHSVSAHLLPCQNADHDGINNPLTASAEVLGLSLTVWFVVYKVQRTITQKGQ